MVERGNQSVAAEEILNCYNLELARRFCTKYIKRIPNIPNRDRQYLGGGGRENPGLKCFPSDLATNTLGTALGKARGTLGRDPLSFYVMFKRLLNSPRNLPYSIDCNTGRVLVKRGSCRPDKYYGFNTRV